MLKRLGTINVLVIFVVVLFSFAGNKSACATELGGKLYRYFGVAAGFYENGRYEEAVEILQYILDKNPEDDYVRNYLKRAKAEMRKEKTEWEKDSEKGAFYSKKNKIKNLVQDGTDYFNAKDFDRALLKFSDTLALDPGNEKAKSYMNKLENHLLKEIKVENLAESQVVGKEELKYIILDKRANNLLNQSELGIQIEEIIAIEKAKEERARKHTLGPGDVLQISVLDHPELSGQVTVQLKGEIILPLVNDIVIAQDLTLEELTDIVAQVMKRYVQTPQLNILALEYNSKLFYIVDELSSTPYPITRTDFTLRDALFAADWGNNRALDRVMVMKPADRYPIIRKINARELIFKGKLENDIRITDGDVIYVPMTIPAKVTKTIHDFLGPFRAVRQARDNYLSLRWNERDWRGLLRMPPDYDRQPEDGKTVNLENISLRDYIVTR